MSILKEIIVFEVEQFVLEMDKEGPTGLMVLKVQFWPRWEFNCSMAIILTYIYERWVTLDKTWVWIRIDLDVEWIVRNCLQCFGVWSLIDSFLMHVDIMNVFMLFFAMKWLYLIKNAIIILGLFKIGRESDVVAQNAEKMVFLHVEPVPGMRGTRSHTSKGHRELGYSGCTWFPIWGEPVPTESDWKFLKLWRFVTFASDVWLTRSLYCWKAGWMYYLKIFWYQHFTSEHVSALFSEPI